MKFHIDVDLLESQNLVGRLKTLELLERQSPFRGFANRFDQRLASALTTLPSELHSPALAVYGTVLYLPQQVLDSAWAFLWHELHSPTGGCESLNDLTLFELDRDAIRDAFYRASFVQGRLQDSGPFRSSYDVLDVLGGLESRELAPEYEQAIAHLADQEHWVLLADFSLSGSSVVSEIRRLRRLSELLGNRSRRITCLVQVVTEQALKAISAQDADLITAIYIPYSSALNHEDYNLITDRGLVTAMKDFCTWFYDSYVIGSKHPLEGEPEHKFGFNGMGWTLVSAANAPNNSLPPLWFGDAKGMYRAPFERLDSRSGPPGWLGRRQWESRIAGSTDLQDRIKRRVSSLGRDWQLS